MAGNPATPPTAASLRPSPVAGPPETDRKLLVRTRLLEHLRRRWFVPVTVVSAPAGYGKTTLLAQAVAANNAAPAGIDCWLTCGPDRTAVTPFAEALLHTVEGPTSASLPLAGHGPADIAEVARAVTDALWRRSPQQVALILDDVHEIHEGSQAADLLEAVVTRLPENGHLVLAGRRAPPVPLARLEVEGRVLHVERTDLAFADAEVTEFAALRGVPHETVTDCGGWPALAELQASARSNAAADYIAQEVLAGLPSARRKDLALLANLGQFDSTVAERVLGRPVDLSALLAGIPLVSQPAEGQWTLHGLWRPLLDGEVSPAEVAEAKRRAGTVLRDAGQLQPAVWRLLDAGAEDDVTETIVDALGVAHPPVAHDVLTEWLARLPAALTTQPVSELLTAVITSESDPDDARERFEAAAIEFRNRDQTAGEIACLVQLGQMAWWSDDADALTLVAKRTFELEAAGSGAMTPLACLGRALLFDIANDSRSMLAELDRILPSSLNEAWWGIVCWARAIGLLELGLTAEALAAAEEAVAHGRFLHAPLAQITRLQALWYQGATEEVLDALPKLLDRVGGSGYRTQTTLVASQAAVASALVGRQEQAAAHLAQAEAAGALVAGAPLVDTNVSIARAAVALASGDETAAAEALTANARRHPLGDGMTAAAQQRHLALFYVLVPASRAHWDAADLGPAWTFGRGLARAVVAVREGREPPANTPALDLAGAVQAHLPLSWTAELGAAAVAAGRRDGWTLLDQTWPTTRPEMSSIAQRGKGSLRRAARSAIDRLAVPPTRVRQLRLLGPVELDEEGTPVQDPEWRRVRVRALLAYLVVQGTVSREQLAEDLWPKLDPDAQSRNLRVTLSYLLKILEPERKQRAPSFFVRQHGDTLTLHPGEWLTVDLWDFDAHCSHAAQADKERAPATALHHALKAAELWRGEPIEVASQPWGIAPMENRRRRFATIATRAGELLLAHGDIERSHTLAGQALAVDPWMEAAHRLTVAIHRSQGDNLAAHRALSRYRESIHDLGFGPDRATLMVERLLESIPPAS